MIQESHLHNILDIWSPPGHLVSMVSLSLFPIVGVVRLRNLSASSLKRRQEKKGEKKEKKNKVINFLLLSTNDPTKNLFG